MVFKVGVSSGIYMAARAPELSSAIKKLGYTLTRGVNAVEIAGDVAHEVPYTMGRQIRQMAEKQGVDLGFHGDLAVPFETPERGEWRDCHDRAQKSLRSAVFIGAKYIDFHASLGIWLELITYAGKKLSQTFCDHEGNFISSILKANPVLRKWFIVEYGDEFYGNIFDREKLREIQTKVDIQTTRKRRENVGMLLQKNLQKVRRTLEEQAKAESAAREREVTADDLIARLIDSVTVRESVPMDFPKDVQKVVGDTLDEAREAASVQSSDISRQLIVEEMEGWLAEGKPWHREESRGYVTIYDGYVIMAHHVFSTKDPTWVAMWAQYPELGKRYKLDYAKIETLGEAIKKADTENDREFKEFFYAAVAAKFLEGHMKRLLVWLYGDFYLKEIPKVCNGDKKDVETLQAVVRGLVIALENPDAREPQHAGMGFIWRPMHLYAAVKSIRQTLKTDKIMIIMDHEHFATQGLDALQESNEFVRTISDFGSLVKTVHSNHPSPLHSHDPIELGDTLLYTLLYNLRVTGMGKTGLTYLIFERGGGDDPFVHSVDALKIMARFLELETPPKELPLEFFGLTKTAGDERRQEQIVKDHAYEPLKDLLQMPDEEFTALSQQVIRGGKRPEQWKKGELR